MDNLGYIAHITSVGERWDLIAWKYYGDASLYSPIILANPHIPIEPVFEAGFALAIPLLQTGRNPTTNLPPWKTAK